MALAFELADLDGSNGFVLEGVDESDDSGSSVSGAGDVNGDGFDDLIVGAPDADPDSIGGAGESYVVFGSDAGIPARLGLESLDGSNGFVLEGIDLNDDSGSSVSGAGDVNGDGFDDLIIGAPFSGATLVGVPDTEPGESYVVFGSDAGFPARLGLETLDGNNGFVLEGIDGDDNSGYSVSGAGDVNGDGFDDLIIGAPDADPDGLSSAGESYVVFGSDSGFPARLELETLDGNNGFVLDGIDEFDDSGYSVSGAGAVNGDGFNDLIIGAPSADFNDNSSVGESYVVFGADSGFPARLGLETLDGSNGLILEGIDEFDESGYSVSGAGDVNGDGFDDLIIGAPDADPSDGSFTYSFGESYVVFGSDSGFPARLELEALDGSNGFILEGIDADDESGYSVSGAGDVNGDGFDDLIIGAPEADPDDNEETGESYVVFGSDAEFPARLELESLSLVLEGINAGDYSGYSVSAGGDVNGDGFDDLIIGAPDAYSNGDVAAGESYVVFGFDFSPIIGTGSNDTLIGTPDSDLINSLGGNDTLDGDVGDDILAGDAGNDSLAGGGGQDQFNFASGEGTDIITDFGGVGTGINPPQAVVDEVDRLEFSGEGLTAENLLLTQNGPNLELAFEGVEETQVILEDFALENLENLSTLPGFGNILFDGEEIIDDTIDVVDANSNPSTVFNSFTVTFLNDLDNDTSGSSLFDVINGQGGNDTLTGLFGDDLLRGGAGDDTLTGGSDNGEDSFSFSTARAFDPADIGVDTITDFVPSEDAVVLSKSTFTALTSAAGGPLDEAEFAAVASDAEAADSGAFIVYSLGTGNLFYNQNGAAPDLGTGAQFASLSGVPANLSAADFQAVA